MRLVKLVALSILAIACMAAPLAAGTPQAGRIARVGSLQIWPSTDPAIGVLRQALRDMGYVEGQTIAVEHRLAEGRADRLPALAAELVQLKVDAIMAAGDPAILAAQQATKTIPIVAITDDLLGAGLVASLARPGGNTTGMSILATELNAKRLELLKESVPRVSRMAALWDPGSGTFHLKSLEAAARSLGVELQILEVRSPDGFRSAFEAAKKGRADALNVLASPFLYAYQKTIIELAAKQRLPAIYQWREMAEAGGLMSYGPNLPQLFRAWVGLLDKVLKGAKPAELPVQQPTRFELVVNMRTAKALGITVPRSILIRADQVIQ